MRIAGVHIQESEKDWKIQHAISEPYGLEMILAIAKEDGHEVGMFVSGEEDFARRIVSFKPSIAAFSLYTSQYETGKKIAEELKRKMPGLIVIAGNRYPTFLRERMPEPFDFFVIKEGEQTFRELLKEMQNGRDYKRVNGLVFRGKEPVFTGPRKRNFNLDLLPDALRFPQFLSQVYRAISIPPLSTSPHYAVVESSRCCYNNCKFCDNEGFWGNRVAFRSPERVVAEIATLIERGVNIFYFMDLNFTAFPEKAEKLCQEMIKQKLSASWYCMSNSATLDNPRGRELLHLMKQAGCFKIAYGVESANDNSLEKMGKRVGKSFTTTEQTLRVLESSLTAGIINQGFYIIGFPWESAESIARDARGIKDIPIHQLNIGIFTPIPLSRFHSQMIQEGYAIDPELKNHDRNTLVFNHRNLCQMTGDAKKDIENGNLVLKTLQGRIYEEFYSSPEFLARTRKTCSIDQRFQRAFNDYFQYIGKEITI